MTDVKVEQCDKEAAFGMLVGKKVGGGDGDTYVARLPSLHEVETAFARHRQAAEKATRERDAGIADAHRQARLDMQKIASERKAKGEARDYETMAIEAMHIATAIRSQNHD